MFRKDNGTVIDHSGRIVFYEIERFLSDICKGEVCFICGSTRKEKKYNDEHVLPDWLLRKYNLYNKSIALSNRTLFKYRQYTIPCCSDCNSLMGSLIEKPIKELLEKGYSNLTSYLKSNGPWLLIIWLSLIFFKTHYKDISLRLSRDLRKDDYKIGDIYEWEQLHHIYCMARSFYSRAILDHSAISTFLLVPARIEDGIENFDYIDLFDAQATLFRYENIAIITVFNDGCGVLNLFRDKFEKINNELHPIQLRELLAILGYLNIIIKNRPVFGSRFDLSKQEYVIYGMRPKTIETNDFDEKLYGTLLYSLCKEFIDRYPEGPKSLMKEYILSGRRSFLFDEKGELQRLS